MPGDFLSDAFSGIGSSLLGGLFGRSNAKQQQEAQMRMTRELAQNKHQWAVQDLRKAGLNPILSATQGTPLPSATAAKADTPEFSSGLGKHSAARLAREQTHTERERQETERKMQDKLVQEAAVAANSARNLGYEADQRGASMHHWADPMTSKTLSLSKAFRDAGLEMPLGSTGLLSGVTGSIMSLGDQLRELRGSSSAKEGASNVRTLPDIIAYGRKPRRRPGPRRGRKHNER